MNITAGAIIIIVILVLVGLCFFFNSKIGKRVRIRASGTANEAIQKDASTPEGAKAYYNAAIEKKEDELYYKKVGKEISPELLLNDIHLSLRRLIEVTRLQETNIKSFLNDYMLQLTEFYNHIFEANKEQVKTLSDEYVHSVGDVLASANREINKRIDTILLSHSESIQEYLKIEKSNLDEIADEVKSFFKGIPESVDNSDSKSSTL